MVLFLFYFKESSKEHRIILALHKRFKFSLQMQTSLKSNKKGAVYFHESYAILNVHV